MIKTNASVGDLCIAAAINIEFKIAAGLLSGKSFSEETGLKICRGTFNERRVTVLQSGIGAPGFAERLAEHLKNNRYDGMIIAGLSGGLDPQLRVGDAVLYNLCYDARAIDFTRRERPDHEEVAAVAGDGQLSGLLWGALTRSSLSFIVAPGITVGRIVTEAKEKLEISARYGAASVDMETYQMLSACEQLDLPAAALRVISDDAGHDTPDFNRGYNADGRINRTLMASAMMARPSATLRLLLTIRPALQSLKASLQTAMSV